MKHPFFFDSESPTTSLPGSDPNKQAGGTHMNNFFQPLTSVTFDSEVAAVDDKLEIPMFRLGLMAHTFNPSTWWKR
jgi:hypothetical protein